MMSRLAAENAIESRELPLEQNRAPLVVSVILNTNRRRDTLECLRSLQAGDYQPHQAVVLDNASSDGSVAAIRAALPSVAVIELTSNLGYAGNNNVGIQAAMAHGADWILILNEDVVLAPDALSWMIAAAAADPAIGIVGPMVYHYDEPTVIQSAGGMLGPRWASQHRGQNQVDVGQFSEPCPVDWVTGCALLVRRAVVEQVGALDPRFFYYWEEVEWCLRARKHGWKVLFAPQARLWHKGVQRDYRPGPNVTYYATRNRLYLFSKHSAPASAWLHAGWWILKHLLIWTVKPKWFPLREHRDAMWQAVCDFARRRWGMRPGIRAAL
jgi:GT2 family glycosyltransferase